MTILVGDDAIRFRNQVRYGRPKRAAVEGVRRGLKMAEEMATTGRVKLRLGEGYDG